MYFLLVVLTQCCLHSVKCSTFIKNDKGLTEVPTIPSSSTVVNLATNKITNISDNAFSHLYQLQELYLQKNKLRVLPNLTSVATSLKILSLYGNNIEEISAAQLDPLVNLQELRLGDHKTLSQVPTIGHMHALKYLGLSICAFKEFPPVNNLHSLGQLTLRNNLITKVAANKLSGLDSLWELDLKKNDITEFPNFYEVGDTLKNLHLEDNPNLNRASAVHVGSLITLMLLKLDNDPLEYLPTTCTANITNLAITAIGSGLKLCDCDNVWLKQATENGASISVNDMTCGSKMWSALSTAELLAICDKSGRVLL